MRSEVIRLAVALPLAVLVPGVLPIVRTQWQWRVLVALPLLALALIPGSPPAGAWIVGGLAALGVVVAGDRGLRVLMPLAVAAGVAGALFTDHRLVGDTLGDLGADNRVLIVLAGFLAATLVSGELVAAVARPFAPTPSMEGVRGAGRSIGWLERAIVFSLIVLAKPEAAALVVTAKSVARLPELGENRQFTEYFLIGTLTSVLLAVACAIATRAALGLS